MKLGVISDTHGLMRPEALQALEGCDAIVHAGDIGKPEVLSALRELAPLHVIRGNNDQGRAWAADVPDCLALTWQGLHIHVVHDIADVPVDLASSVDVVITGHSHKPVIDWRGDRLWLNPGSAGPRRFSLPITVACIEIHLTGFDAHLIPLLPTPAASR